MYNCEKCNLNYTSRMGLYNHNKQYHQDKIGTKKSPRTNFCIFCNKEFKHNQNKWKHEKICKYKEEYYKASITRYSFNYIFHSYILFSLHIIILVYKSSLKSIYYI